MKKQYKDGATRIKNALKAAGIDCERYDIDVYFSRVNANGQRRGQWTMVIDDGNPRYIGDTIDVVLDDIKHIIGRFPIHIESRRITESGAWDLFKKLITPHSSQGFFERMALGAIVITPTKLGIDAQIKYGVDGVYYLTPEHPFYKDGKFIIPLVDSGASMLNAYKYAPSITKDLIQQVKYFTL